MSINLDAAMTADRRGDAAVREQQSRIGPSSRFLAVHNARRSLLADSINAPGSIGAAELGQRFRGKLASTRVAVFPVHNAESVEGLIGWFFELDDRKHSVAADEWILIGECLK
jgi:hypothetical protein